MIEWNTLYSVGIEEFDEQHKELIRLINNLSGFLYKHQTPSEGNTPSENNLRAGEPGEEGSDILAKLKEYAEKHFKAEERFMVDAGFPGYMQHKLKHEDFKKKLNSFSSGDNQLPEILFFLQTWLINHIKGVDKEYAAYSLENNKTPGNS